MNKKNILFSKLIIILLLTLVISYAFLQNANQQYQSGLILTKELYVSQYKKHKEELLSYKQFTNTGISVLSTFIVISIIVSSYELFSFIISLLIKNVFNIGAKQSQSREEENNTEQETPNKKNKP